MSLMAVLQNGVSSVQDLSRLSSLPSCPADCSPGEGLAGLASLGGAVKLWLSSPPANVSVVGVTYVGQLCVGLAPCHGQEGMI